MSPVSSGFSAEAKPHVLIIGGGIAHDRVELVMVSADADFRYRPMAVDEPFSLTPYERKELEPVVTELGAQFVGDAVRCIRPDDHVAELANGEPIRYDLALVCIGAITRPAFTHAFNFVVPGPPLDATDLVERARGSDPHRIAFVVPSGVTWALPIYELALLTAKLLSERREEAELVLVSPEASPLAIFGTRPSEAVGELLRTRGIEFCGGVHAHEADKGMLVLAPGDEELRAAALVALPLLEGPAIEGLPTDQNGFIPIDEHARVYNGGDLYAAGDATNFPIKQGGLATQQADAAAEHIAARLGADLKPEAFEPILRGKLITGGETMSMTANVASGDSRGFASPDYLWWPPFKVSGRYLTPWLAGEEQPAEPVPPMRSMDVEVALPREWHRDPMALDPYRPTDR
jgi:sulfide:quinone oxidoreductase